MNSQRNTYVAPVDASGKPKTSPLRIQSRRPSSHKSKLDRKRSVQFSIKEREIIDDFLGDETDQEEMKMSLGDGPSRGAADRAQSKGGTSDRSASSTKEKKTISVQPLAPSSTEMTRIPSLDSDTSLQEKLRSAATRNTVEIPSLDDDEDTTQTQKESFFQVCSLASLLQSP